LSGCSFITDLLPENKPEQNLPANAVDQVNISAFKEGSYKIEKTIELTKVTSSHIYWKGERNGWPQKTVKTTVDGIIFLGVVRDGKVIAFGKIDWTRPNQVSKGLENVAGGYGVFADVNKRPKSGDKVFVCITKVDSSARTPTSNLLNFP